MKNKFNNLIEELSSEPRSLDYDSIFSSMLKIDSKAREIAKGYGVPVGQIYKAIDFNPEGYFSVFGSDAEGSDFAHSDIMCDLQVLEKQLVPEPHRQYGGKLLPEFLNNEDALFGFFEKPKPKPAGAEGEVVMRKEIVLKEEMGYVDKIVKFAGEHPYLSAGC